MPGKTTMGNISRTSILPNKKSKSLYFFTLKNKRNTLSATQQQRQNMKYIYPIILLAVSNIFMTFAWYGHLRFKSHGLWSVILISWLIAFFEYCFQVPTNRLGHEVYSVTQLKVIQEVITLAIFIVFSIFYMKEGFHWNHAVGFLLILLAVFFIFKKWD